MEEELNEQIVEEIELDDPKQIIDFIKDQVKEYLEEAIEDIKKIPSPQPSEYETKEKALEAWNMYQVQVIEYIKKEKTDLLKFMIENYSSILDDKMTIDSSTHRQKQITEMILEMNDSRIKKRVIVATILVLLFPKFVSPIIIFSIPSIYYYIYQGNASLKLQEDYINTQQLLRQIRDDFYDELNILREDYHSTNAKFSELEIRARKGENILEEAISYLNPNILEDKAKVYEKVQENLTLFYIPKNTPAILK